MFPMIRPAMLTPFALVALAFAVHPGLAATTAATDGRPKLVETRGALLYSVHCNACHTSKIHWREKRLAKDLGSLKSQVRLWQGRIGLGWTEDEIADVVRYLNAAYYGFPDPSPESAWESGKSLQAQDKN